MFYFVTCRFADLPELLEVAKTSFIEAFDAKNTREAMEGYMIPAFKLEKWEAEFLNPHSHFELLKENEQIIGYIKLNFYDRQGEFQEEDGVEVERCYLLEKYHGTGCGQKLMDKCLEIAQARKMRYIWLGVWERNPKAMRFYEKNGFHRCGEHVFRMGNEDQIDFLMRKDL